MDSSSTTSSFASKCTASAILTEIERGSHCLKVTPYSLTKGIGIGECIKSCTFTVGEHSWVIDYYPDGDEQNAEYIALYLRLKSDGSHAKVQFTIGLLDQNGSLVPQYNFKSAIRTFSNADRSWGYQRFMKRADLEASNYLKDDCVTFRCELTIIKEPRAKEIEIPCVVVPPSDLHQHLSHLLLCGKGKDVMFEVGGETFEAHRCVLAARSSVFQAELFGLKERSSECIKIDDMEAEVFKALLHFIYTDSLPTTTATATPASLSEMEEPSDDSVTERLAMTSITGHLLVAADRYGLERLKLICEDKLCKEIDVSNVATTLALAEQHCCQVLKAACLEFMVSCGRLKAVMATNGFKHLKRSCPTILEDILGKAGNLL